MLRTYRPLPPLASHVEMLWYYDGDVTAHHKEYVLPNGKFQVIVDLSCGRGMVFGMQSRHSVIDPATIHSVMGVVFRPGGARGFFDAPGDHFYNQFVPLDLVWGSRVTELLDNLREADTVE